MRVGIVLSRIENGGLERVQAHIAKQLQERGFDVLVAAGRVLHRNPQIFPMPVEEISRPGRLWFPFALAAFLRRAKLDCIFTTSNDVACLAVALKRMWFRDLKVVVTQHTSLSGPLAQARGIHRMKLLAVRVAMRLALPHADAVVAVTQNVAGDLESHCGLGKGHVQVIRNPVISPDFDDLAVAPTQCPWPEDGMPVVVFLGRLSPEKRIDLLLEAVARLRAEIDLRLVIIGEGPQRTWIEDRIAAAGFGEACVMTGFIDNVLPLLCKADLLVLPSDFEGSGNVLVEAMACGVQVVATDCPHGPSEILEQGRYGQLVPMNDASALHAAIRRSLRGEVRMDPALLKSRARQFSVSEAADAYFALVGRVALTSAI